MTAYLGCCCAVGPAPTCENQTPGYSCQPEAILVEGFAIQTKSGSSTETDTVSCECAACSSGNFYNETNYEIVLETSGACFVRVQFKALLIRSNEVSYQTPAVNSGPYSPVASISGAFETNYTRQEENIGNGLNCSGCGFQSCDGTYRETTIKNVSSSNGNDEYELLNFSLGRTVRNFGCEEITPCATEGCYEIFSVNAQWQVAGETSGSYTYYKEQCFFNAFTGECFNNVEDDFGLSCSANGYTSDSLQINQYSAIYAGELNVCPQDVQRPVSFTIDLGAYTSPPNSSCTVPVACECQDLKGILLHTYGLRGDSLVANGITTGPPLACSGANWNAAVVAFGNDCSGFHNGKGGMNQFDGSESGTALSCSENNTPTCMASTQCGAPRPITTGCSNTFPNFPQNGSRSRSGSFDGSNGAGLYIERYELLYSLPDPSDWPANV